jgi:hypothetical protein
VTSNPNQPTHQRPIPTLVRYPRKSMLLAAVLTALFGPFGLFYVSVPAAVIFLFIIFAGNCGLPGIFLPVNVVLYFVMIIWAVVAASSPRDARIIYTTPGQPQRRT